MHRKLLGIYLALAIFAIVPAAASATFLTDTSGGVTTLVKVGSKIKGISEGTSVFSLGSSLIVECNENYLTGEVVKNSGTVELTVTGGKFQSNLTTEGTLCTTSFGRTTITFPTLTSEGGKSHWCIKSGAGDSFNLFGRSCGEEGNGVLTINLGGIGCKYKREALVSGTFTTPANHTASTLAVTGNPVFKSEESPLCPSEFTFLTLTFNLYTDTGEPNAWDDAASTGDPVWVSEKE